MELVSKHDPLTSIGGRERVRRQANAIRDGTYQNKITVSRNYFFPLVKYCRNSCLYCGFSRKVKSKLKFEDMVMKPEEVIKQLAIAKQAGCREALFVLGDRPEEINRNVRKFFEENGFENSVEYTKWACKEAIKIGLEPHVNLGVITYEEWDFLRPVIVSAGLMLETVSDRLTKKGEAHHGSPDKLPSVRIKCIESALELKIPFTSGLLLGIGETDEERLDTLRELKRLAEDYETLQEIIVQPFHPLPNTPWKTRPQTPPYLLLDTIAAGRVILPPEINIQFPPNLTDFPIVEGIRCGANDLGGVSPVTVDFVNYTSPWPKLDFLESYLKNYGFELVERGPVYEKWQKFINSVESEEIK